MTPDRFLAVQELRALGFLDESEYKAEASGLAEVHERSALQRQL
jgi:hypothetical protein